MVPSSTTTAESAYSSAPAILFHRQRRSLKQSRGANEKAGPEKSVVSLKLAIVIALMTYNPV
jgi:hypothetical protein